MEVIQTDCGLCINCCGINAYVEDGKLVKVEGIEDHWLNKGAICPKGARVPEYVYSANRVKTPLKKVDGKFQAVSWGSGLAGNRRQAAGTQGQIRRQNPGHLYRFRRCGTL